MTWKKYLSNPKYRIEFIVTLSLFGIVLISLTHFTNFVEGREGIILPDPILRLFNPVNLTWLTFGLIYSSLLLAIFLFMQEPIRLMTAIQVYTFMVLSRMVAMYLVPLNAPAQMIPLHDPFVQFFNMGRLLTKDLFFSGHTATLFLLFLVAEKHWQKILFLLSTLAVGTTVILQHVHYSIDVLAAPFFTYACYCIAKVFRQIIFGQKEPGSN